MTPSAFRRSLISLSYPGLYLTQGLYFLLNNPENKFLTKIIAVACLAWACIFIITIFYEYLKEKKQEIILPKQKPLLEVFVEAINKASKKKRSL